MSAVPLFFSMIVATLATDRRAMANHVLLAGYSVHRMGKKKIV